MSEATIKFRFVGEDKVSSTISNINKSLDGLRNIAQTAAGVVGGMFAFEALGAIKQGIEDSVKSFADFEEIITRTAALSGATGEELKQMKEELEKAARSAGLQFGVGATAAAQALESLVKAGLEGEKAVQALNATLQLAAIENIDAGKAADLLVGVLNQFGFAAEEASKVTDMLVNASAAGIDTASEFATALSYVGGQAANMGISLEETLAALIALNNQGISAEKAGRYLSSMFTDLIEKSDKLGFSIYDESGKMLSLSEIIQNLNDHLASFSTQAERNAYLTEIFGSQGMRAALALMNLGEVSGTTEEEAKRLAKELGLSRVEIEAMRRESATASQILEQLSQKVAKTGTASEVTEKQLSTTSGVMKRMQAAIQDLMLDLGEALAPIITDIANFLREHFVPALKWVIDNFKKLIDWLKPHVIPALEFLWNIFTDIWQGLEKVVGWITSFIDALTKIGSTIWSAVEPALSWIKGIIDGIAGAIETVQKAISGLGSWLIGGGSETTTPTVVEETEEIIGMQAGGIVTRPTLALIGERGPEAVIPLSKIRSLGGPVIHNYFYIDASISSDYDLEEFARKLGEYIAFELERMR